ncbi:BREX-2 system adenine-specific DNA-methyltransferase PglX [Arthrobacter sp. Marseille-P9274]|uniref:BREX-2 system adenine-specific DNA-methyltransferase PglX n=1 Tax=Arthrobacter sp. Marseille-P9274 TaxID=2866572 RepID=UPI0021C5AFF9|nr:BREX-2 system adenine-specific DNA-methyltransferase PglX [Arthrobacter sp. Marseille-P9274]
MIDSKLLLADLKKQLKLLEADLRAEATRPSGEESLLWSDALKNQHAEATRKGRTARTFSDWLEGEVSQASVAWIVASTFIRFCEDNRLLPSHWIAGNDTALNRAVEAETAFFVEHPTSNARDWLREAFGVLADLPAGRALVDRRHNAVWNAPISSEAARNLLNFWRATHDDGRLVHDFRDPDLETRFLGDLYQDLSEYAKKTFALLQTPDFVEEFILDQTLTPAIAEFGLDGLKLIDPTCGSGHFLLGAFERLNREWTEFAPGIGQRERVQKALDSIHGIDLNPFAVAISRFRLTVAALKTIGEKTLTSAPAFGYHLAVGDSLIGAQGRQGDLFAEDSEFSYAAEDVSEYGDILRPDQYHVVVGNPPYITVKDKALNEWYRAAYETCAGKYALSVPFMELFFRLAIRGTAESAAGYVGQITSNSFMKREFGKKVIQDLLSGKSISNPVDLTAIIDTSGAYIPGHGTPTVILVGRRRHPVADTVRAVLGVRGEPGQPANPAKGLVWSEIVENIGATQHNGSYVTVATPPREVFATHPWSLSGGGAGDLKQALDAFGKMRLASEGVDIGLTDLTGEDDAFTVPQRVARRLGWIAHAPVFVEGDRVRDYRIDTEERTLLPVTITGTPLEPTSELAQWFWPLRSQLAKRIYFGQTPEQRGLRWFDHAMYFAKRHVQPMSITFAFVATHNHFVLDRGGKVFNRSAPVIKLPADATEEDHLKLLGVLNSSTACFWLKQVCHNKGSTVDTKGARQTQVPWEDFYEFTGTKLQSFPLPSVLNANLPEQIDGASTALTNALPGAIVKAFGDGTVTDTLAILLAEGRELSEKLRARMVFLQEELDWKVYKSYGLVEEDLTYHGQSLAELNLGERAFEIHLARNMAKGQEESAWFDRHSSSPRTDIPAEWPEDYHVLVQKRLDLIGSNPDIALLERPEFKRRWASVPWEAQQRDALTDFVRDRLEDPKYWQDGQGPVHRTVAQLADAVKGDAKLTQALQVLTGTADIDLVPALTSLITDEAVPFVAQFRYKESGLTKFRDWQHVWALQRREDAGDKVEIPVPPKYKPTDFLKTTYWQARGKLDVPKERFISYPNVHRPGDGSQIFGWAGWNHAEAALALARTLTEQDASGASKDDMVPLLAGLEELESWVAQWHAEMDPAIGGSPAAAISGLLDQYLLRLGLTREDLKSWRAPATATGRRRKSAQVKEGENA